MINSYNCCNKGVFNEKKSILTEDASKSDYFLENQSSTFQNKSGEIQEVSEVMEVQKYPIQESSSLNELKDSLRIDFSDMKIFENDLQFEPRRVEDDWFTFDIDSFIY